MTYAEQEVIKAAELALGLLSQKRVSPDDLNIVRNSLVDIMNITRYADDINCISNEYDQVSLENESVEC